VSHRRNRGFTLVEMMVVLAILVTLAALAAISLQRARPRANLANVSTELLALLRNARQNAMATGRNTVVVVFPQFQNPDGGTGRVIVFEDPDATFFRAATSPNFQTLVPGTFNVGAATEILLSIDLPRGTEIGGALATALAAPYERVDGSLSCGFCSTGLDGRGAVQYDSRGRATFHSANGAALDLWGAALSLRAVDPGNRGSSSIDGVRTLVLTSTAGGVRSISGG
jgi:prepilin-type N-terminal cleavage/methylation domain-containing protein